MLIGDGALHLPERGSFVGRRAEVRNYLRPFLEKETRCILLTGPGGVGKTALASQFARRLLEREPQTRLLGFCAPFDLDKVYQVIHEQAVDGNQAPGLVEDLQRLNFRDRLQRLLQSLTNREKPCAFLLDNLESLQEKASLSAAQGHEDSQWFVGQVCRLPARVLMTGRYRLPPEIIDTLPQDTVTRCPVTEAPLGDILHRMRRLNWPSDLDAKEKKTIYATLGGNHRAVEWMAQLLTESPEKAAPLTQALEKLQAPPDTPSEMLAIVLEAMRQNLLFNEIRKTLTPEQDRLVRALTLYRVPVNADGLLAAEAEGLAHDTHRANVARLVDYSLLDEQLLPVINLTYYSLPAVIRELVDEPGFSISEAQTLHTAMGKHHQFQGKRLTRRLIDFVEAIHHFRQPGLHVEADTLAEGVCGYYYNTGNFADAKRLCSEVVERKTPPPPWWALTRYGMCQSVFGNPHKALEILERALAVVDKEEDRGATLSNIADIYRIQGKFKKALLYLEKSLKIRQDIGDRRGEGKTLNNISLIFQSKGQYDQALKYLEQSLKIKQEIGDKQGEGVALNNIGLIFQARSQYDQALTIFEHSLKLRQEIGDKQGEGLMLNNIGSNHRIQGQYDQAMSNFEQGLKIMKEIGDKQGEGVALNGIGLIFQARGQYDQALSNFEQGLNPTTKLI